MPIPTSSGNKNRCSEKLGKAGHLRGRSLRPGPDSCRGARGTGKKVIQAFVNSSYRRFTASQFTMFQKASTNFARSFR